MIHTACFKLTDQCVGRSVEDNCQTGVPTTGRFYRHSPSRADGCPLTRPNKTRVPTYHRGYGLSRKANARGVYFIYILPRPGLQDPQKTSP